VPFDAVRKKRQLRLGGVKNVRVDVHRVVRCRSNAATAEVFRVPVEPGGLRVISRRVLGIERVMRSRRRDVQHNHDDDTRVVLARHRGAATRCGRDTMSPDASFAMRRPSNALTEGNRAMRGLWAGACF
jgi:hypothetical protein